MRSFQIFLTITSHIGWFGFLQKMSKSWLPGHMNMALFRNKLFADELAWGHVGVAESNMTMSF